MGKELEPELRFEGFEEPWRQNALAEICKSLDTGKSVNSEDRAPSKGEISILKTSCVSEDYFNPKERKRVVPSEVSLVKCPATAGSIIVSRMNTPERVGACGYVADNYQNLFLPDRLWRLTLEAGYDPYLIYTSLVSPSYRAVVKGMASGTSGSMHNVPQEAFLKMALDTPGTKEEQAQIGDLFRDLDSLIAEQERRCAALSAARAALLDKMFPKEGETEPELRFDGFSGPWERVRLGEVGTARSGIGFPETEQGGSEGIPFFKVSDMNSVGNEFELIRSANYVNREQVIRNKWNPISSIPAIFFAKVGAAVMHNRKRLVARPFLLDNNTMAYSMDTTKVDPLFCMALFETIYLPALCQVGALPSYNAIDIESLEIPIPTMEEQVIIGKTLYSLRSRIKNENQKLDLLKQLKGAMLDKMFPKGAR